MSPDAIERTHFRKEDIGADLLPILTEGLYRDALDTLREYIQNSIDASATNIEMRIDPDVASIRDDGHGMTVEEANNAIRLGISGKNPLHNVGFRGIGVYSAFNLCDKLEIYTRPRDESSSSVLTFNFRQMREQLLIEEERRKTNAPAVLYLESMLQQTVFVARAENQPLSSSGTLAVLSGLRSEVYDELNSWTRVTEYLQNVVPLPFHPNFRYKEQIEAKLVSEELKVIPVSLGIGARTEQLYRPYTDQMFAHGGTQPPEFFPVSDGRQHFGIAWVCINDERKVLKDQSLRGILIKKFGFSIATRSFLEPYFIRTVFSRRITGELIVEHPQMIPNAARSDFEHNSARQAFFQIALPRFVGRVSDWANRIQQVSKAREVLQEVETAAHAVAIELPRRQRDREWLLNANLRLADTERSIQSHARLLRGLEHERLTEVLRQLKETQATVREALMERHQTRRKLEERAERAARSEARVAATQAPVDTPASLVDLLDAFDLLVDPLLRKAVTYIDDELLQTSLDSERYRYVLAHLRDLLEEGI